MLVNILSVNWVGGDGTLFNVQMKPTNRTGLYAVHAAQVYSSAAQTWKPRVMLPTEPTCSIPTRGEVFMISGSLGDGEGGKVAVFGVVAAITAQQWFPMEVK